MDTLLILAAIATMLYFSFSAGKKVKESKANKEKIDAISKALEARASINTTDDAVRVLLEHKD